MCWFGGGWVNVFSYLHSCVELQVALAAWFYLQSVRCPLALLIVSVISQACLQDRHVASGGLQPFHPPQLAQAHLPIPLRSPTSLEPTSKHSRPPRVAPSSTLRHDRTPKHPRKPRSQRRRSRRDARRRGERRRYEPNHSRGRRQGGRGKASERVGHEGSTGAEASAGEAAAAESKATGGETSASAEPSTTASPSSGIPSKATHPTTTSLARRRRQACPRRHRTRLAFLKRETVLKQQRRRQTIQRHNRRRHPRLLPRHLRNDFRRFPRKHRDGVLDDRLPCSAEQLQDPWHEIRDQGFEDDEVRHLRLGSG